MSLYFSKTQRARRARDAEKIADLEAKTAWARANIAMERVRAAQDQADMEETTARDAEARAMFWDKTATALEKEDEDV